METFAEIINKLPDQVNLEKAKGINATVQFAISGQGGGDWALTINDGLVTILDGQHPKPQLIIKASDVDAVRLLQGDINPISAFMTGKVKIVGDMALAMKLLNLLK